MWTVPFQGGAFPDAASADALLQQARRAFQAGALSAEELLPPALAYVSRSWRRSLEAGLDAFAPRHATPNLSSAELAQAVGSQHEWLAHARPVMEYLLGQTRAHAPAHRGMVILADANGLLLQAVGDNRFLQRAERVALSPGASWHEEHRGTNAIGTALAEAAPVMVHGMEHFLECNGFLSCAAAPVRAPDGRVLGVLDFSSERQLAPPQVFGAVCAAAQMIENRLFLAQHGRQLRLHFHPLPEGLGTLAEGVVAISDDGILVGANAAALALLGIAASQLGRIPLQQVFEADLDQLLRSAHGQHGMGGALPLRTVGGGAGGARPHTLLHGRAVPGQRSPGTTVVLPAATSVISNPRRSADLPGPLQALDTGDAAWRSLLGKAHKVLDRPIALLLHGESGTGKEVLARAIHHSSARAAHGFVAVNCAALPENLIEAELFGYAPGAFTGGRREGAPGLIRQAHRGTLFLDEIGDMPLALQTRLLRVLQERQVTPLGGGAPMAVDFALICASHRDLKAEVAAGRFRGDLYWRLNGLYLQLPALRQRSDGPALVQRLLQHHAQGQPTPVLSEALAQALQHYDWPGNLRQLDSVLRTAVALSGGESVIDWEHLPDDLAQELRGCSAAPMSAPMSASTTEPTSAPALPHETGNGDGERPHEPQPTQNGTPNRLRHPTPPQQAPNQGHARASTSLADTTLQALQRAVDEAGGNMSQAARTLGISRNTLYRRLKKQTQSL